MYKGNGGLFVDMGVLILKKVHQTSDKVPSFAPSSDVVVEWRGLTIGLLDMVGDIVRDKLGMTKEALPLVKILEAGTWKAVFSLLF